MPPCETPNIYQVYIIYICAVVHGPPPAPLPLPGVHGVCFLASPGVPLLPVVAFAAVPVRTCVGIPVSSCFFFACLRAPTRLVSAPLFLTQRGSGAMGVG